jgi:hypothetical protein
VYTKRPAAAAAADVLFKEWSAMVWVLRAVEASIGKQDSFPCCSSSTHQRYMHFVNNLSLHFEFGWQFLLLQECLLLWNAISNFKPRKDKLHAEIALQRDTAELWSGRHDDDANA